MKPALASALFILLVLVGYQAFSFLRQEHQLNSTLHDTENRLTQAQQDEANLQAENQYLSNPANMEKELRADFNYKKPGETMVIIVPAQASTTSQNR